MKTLTQEDLDANPVIATLGGYVGGKLAALLSDEDQAKKDAEDAGKTDEEQA